MMLFFDILLLNTIKIVLFPFALRSNVSVLPLDFITKVPTTFDETVPLDSKVAEYVSIARRKGDVWFVGAMTNWSPRELTMDLSFLGAGEYKAEIFKDGINANRDATDYKKEVITVKSSDKLNVKLMNGGGWVARFSAIEP